MNRGQTTLEFLMILGVALLILLVTITISNEQGSALSTRKAELQASLAATDIGNAAREVYAQGIGARKLAFVTFPRSYNGSLSSINDTAIRIRAGRTDYVQTFPFQVKGTLPSRPGAFEFLVENEGGVINVGRWLAYANASAIGGSINSGESYSESIDLSSISSSDSNITVQCVWENGSVNMVCPVSQVVLPSHSNTTIQVSFDSDSDAYGTYSGYLNITVAGAGGNQSIEIPVSVFVNDPSNPLYNRIVFLPPTPANGASTPLSLLGVQPIVINASVQNMTLGELRFKLGTTEYKQYDDSLVLMYNFDNVAALGEGAGTVADASNYGNNGSVYGNTRLLMHMDEADGNTTFDESAWHNNGAIYGNTRLLLHMDENAGGTAYDESAYKNNGTCVGMTSLNGANACSWVAGKNGAGISFDGADDIITFSNSSQFNLYPVTVEGWFKRANTGGYEWGLINKYASSSGNGYNVFIVSNQLEAWYFRDASNKVFDRSALFVELTDLNWHHFAFTVDPSGGKLYFDGVLAKSAPWSGTPGATTTSEALRIGTYPPMTTDRLFNGTLDEFALYSKALSADEVYAHYNATKPKHVDWTTGKSGTGLQFDGVDDYVLSPLPLSGGTSTPTVFTIAAWIKTNAIPSNNWVGIFAQESTVTPGNQNNALFLNTDGKIYQDVYPPSGGAFASSTILAPNTWYYLVSSRNGNSRSIYINGVLDNSDNGGEVYSGINVDKAAIGGLGPVDSTNHYFNGTIDEVAVYNRVLTPSEILDQFASGRATHPDSVAGVYGNALNFDGLDDYINASRNSILNFGNNSFSITAWISPKDFATYDAIVSKWWDGSNRGYSFEVGENGVLRLEIGGSDGHGYDHYPPVALTKNVFQFVGVSFNGASYTFYINGVPVDVWSPAAPGGLNNNADLLIGKYSHSSISSYFNGSIDEVRIWNRALSAVEIQQQYQSNLAKFAPDKWLFSSTHTQLDSKRYNYTLLARDRSGDYDRVSRSFTVTYGTIGFVPSTPLSGASGSSATTLLEPLSINASIANASLSAMSVEWNATNYSQFDNNLIASYSFDRSGLLGENATNFVDSSRSGLNGTCYGESCPSYAEGKYGNALYFDGFEDYVSVPNDAVLNSTTSQFSLSYWVKPSAIENAGLVSKSGLYGVQVLVVGGGGGGANSDTSGGGGGGAGGVLQGNLSGLSGSYAVVVGAGGLHASGRGARGGDSLFGNYIAYGGGGGGYYGSPGGSGGSTGGYANGGGYTGAVMQTSQYPLTGYGNSGVFLGGGGATGNGTTYNNGPGLYSTITGTNTYYAGGGGWNEVESVYYGQGGAPKGSGYKTGNDGKQGIVIIRYPTSYGNATGGNITTVVDGGVTYRVHTFTSNGTFTTNGTSGWATGLAQSGKVSFKLGLNSMGYQAIESNTALSAENWYFVTSTWNGTQMSVYLNGVLESTQPAVGILNGTSDVNIGRDANSGGVYFDGTIDELRIWNRSLTASEVAQHYVSSLRKYAPGKWLLSSNQSVATPATYSYAGYAMDAVGWNSTGARLFSTVYNRIGFLSPTPPNNAEANLTAASVVGIPINISLAGTNLSQFTFNWNSNPSNSSGANYSIYDPSLVLAYNFDNNSAVGDSDARVTDVSPYGNTGAVSSNLLTLHFDENDGYVAYDSGPLRSNGTVYGNTLGLWHMDEGSGNIAYDSGIYKRNGTLSGPAWAVGKSGNALQFDGVDDYVETYDYSWNASNSFSMSIWFNTRNASQNQVLVSKSTYEYSLRIDNGSGLGLYFVYWTSAGADNLALRFGNVSSNAWNHVVVSYDAASRVGRGYLNGQLVATHTPWSVDFINRALPTRLGYGYHVGSAFYSFNGTLDEFAIYNRSLSADEALAQYNEGKAKFAEWDSDGKSGTALRFDGVDDYVLLSNPSALNSPAPKTVVAWVKTAVDLPQLLIGIGNTGDSYQHQDICLGEGCTSTLAGELITLGRQASGHRLGYVTSSRNELFDGDWHHIAVTYSGSTATLYLDGVNRTLSIGQGTNDGLWGGVTGVNKGTIGDYYLQGNRFNGSIDELAVYNATFSAAQVQQLYLDSKPKRLNYVDGKYGKALAFDGNSSYVDIGTNTFNSLYSNGNGQMTFEAWVNAPVSLDDGVHYIINLEGWYVLKAQARRAMAFFTGSSSSQVDSGVFINDCAWHHVVSTYDGTRQSIYVDGFLRNSSTAALGNIVSDNTINVVGGAVPINTQFWNGSIDEVRVWNRSLSASEISQHYYSNLAKYAPDKWFFSTSQIANASGSYSFSAYLRDADGAWNSTGTRTVSVTNSSAISFISPTPADGSSFASNAIPVRASVINASNLSLFYMFWNNTAYSFYDDSLVLAYNFDNVATLGENATRVVDVSKYGNNGTVNGSPAWTPAGTWGGAMQFDGVNDFVEVPLSSSLSSIANDFTMSAWFRRAGLAGGTSDAGYHGIIRGGRNWAPRILIPSNGLGVLLEECLNGSAAWHGLYNSTVTFGVGEWHQITVRKGSYGTEIYVDGGLKAFNSSMVGTTTVSTTSFYVGTGATPLVHYMANGSIDEVRVWNRSLSADEIRQHYYSNFAKYAPDKWLFSSTLVGATSGALELRVLAKDTLNNSYQDRRSVLVNYNQVAFTSPTPSDKRSTISLAALPFNPVVINASIYNISLSSLSFQWGATNYSIYNDSLVLAYNFDNVQSIGDTAGVAKDVSRSGNNGALYGNTRLLLHMDESSGNTSYDESAYKSNGTCYNMGGVTGASACNWVAGKSGNGVSFDGSNDYISSAAGPSLNLSSSMTMSAWIRPLDANQRRVMGVFNAQGQANPWYAILYSGQRIRLQMRNITGDWALGDVIWSNTKMSTNAWHHVVVTFNRPTISFYADGVLDGTAIWDSSIGTSASPYLYIGARGDVSAAECFNGSIDEAAIYSKALSPAEVLEHYNAGKAKHADYSTDGKWGGALQFDGVDDFVNVTSSSALDFSASSNYSYSAWFKTTDGGNRRTIIADIDYGVTKWTEVGVRRYSQDYEFYLQSGVRTVTYVNPQYFDNNWHQIVGVVGDSGTSVSLYLDGVLVNRTTGLAPVDQSTGNITIGAYGKYYANGNSIRLWNGSLDEVRVWNRSLSADEIQQGYYSSLNKYAPDKWLFTYNVPSELAPQNYNVSVYANDRLAGPSIGSSSGRKWLSGLQDRIGFLSQTPASGSTLSSSSTLFDPIVINASISNVSLSSAKLNWNGANYSLYDDSLVLMYNFDSNAAASNSVFGGNDEHTKLLIHGEEVVSGSAFNESSPSANNVTRYGNATQSAAQSKFGGKSWYFDGNAGSYLSLPASSDFDVPTGTLDWWMYANSWSNLPIVIGSNISGVIGGYVQYYQSELRFYAPGNINTINFGNPSTSVWHHYALVVDGSYIYAFLDGNLVGSRVAYSGKLFNGSSSSFVVGGMSGYPANIFSGFMDEVRLSKGIARWTSNFTPPSGPYSAAMVPDASKYGNDGVNNGAALTGAGKFGGALKVNDLGDYVYVSDRPLLSPTVGVTLSAWVNPAVLPTGTNGALILGKAGQYELVANATGFIFTDRNVSAYVPVALPVGEWHQLTGTIAANANLSVYLDGALKASVPFGVMNLTSNAFAVGGLAGVPAYPGSVPTVYSATCTATNLYGTESNCPADDTANAQLSLAHNLVNTTYRAASSGAKTYTHIFDYGAVYSMDGLVWDGFSTGYCCEAGCSGCHNDNNFYLYGSTEDANWFSIGAGCGKLPCANANFGAKPIRYVEVYVVSSCNGCSNYDYVDSWGFSSSSGTKIACGAGATAWACGANQGCGATTGVCTQFINGTLDDFDGAIDEVRVWNRTLSSDEVAMQYSSNLAKYSASAWLLSSNWPASSVGTYSFYGFANEPSGGNFTSTRTVYTSNNSVGFILPTPANNTAVTLTAAAANGILLNASLAGLNLSQFKFNWNGTNYSIYDDSLVLAYNFDNASAIGDTNERVADASRYGNTGGVSGNVLTLHFDEQNGSAVLDSGPYRNNGVIYGDTNLLLHFDEADGSTAYDDTRFANNGMIYGNTRMLLHMDENAGNVAYDESAYRNNGTCYGMGASCTWATGKNRSGIAFDGVDDYVNLSDANLPNGASSRSVEMWVRPKLITNTYQVMFGYGSISAGNFYSLGIDYSSHKYYISQWGGSVAGNVAVADQWVHLVATYDGSIHRLYQDGAIVTSGAMTTNTILNGSLGVGKQIFGTPYNFNGTLDEVAIYSKALNATEVLDHYNAGKAKHVDWTTGKSGTGLAFDGVDDYVKVDYSASLDASSTVTVEAWVNFDGIQMSYAGIVDKRQSYRLRTGPTYKMYFDMEFSNGSWFDSNPSNSAIAPYSWHHLVATYDRALASDNVKYYIDGAFDKAYSTNGYILQVTDGLSVGRLDNAQMFKGSIDEVAVYTRSLSASEVADHYSAGKAKHLERGTGRVGGGVQFDGVRTFANGSTPTLNATPSASIVAWFKTSVQQSNRYIFSLPYTSSGGNGLDLNVNGALLKAYSRVSGVGPDPNVTVNYYDGRWHQGVSLFNGTHTCVFFDAAISNCMPRSGSLQTSASGEYNVGRFGTYGAYFNGSIDEVAVYNRSLSPAEISQMYEDGVPKHLNYADGKFGNALAFDGLHDFVSVSNSAALNPSLQLSVEAWVKTGALGSRQTIVSKDYLLNTDPYYQYHAEVRATGELYFALSIAGVRQYIDTTGFAISPGQWYHYVATYDGSAIRLYRNGVQYPATVSASGSISSYATDLQIGRIFVGGSDIAYFNGSIDEVRIWNRSLTAAEISQHYYSNLNKYAPDRWLFSSTQPISSAGNYTYFASTKDVAGNWNLTEKRTVQVYDANPISFVSPTPADGAAISTNAIQMRASLVNVSSLDQFRLFSQDKATSFYDDSLVLAYNFDNVASIGENATRAVDVSKYGNNGTINGSSWTAGGKYGGAMSFDGVDDYVYATRVEPPSALTIGFWIKVAEDCPDNAGVITKWNQNADKGFSIVVNPDGKLAFYLLNGYRLPLTSSSGIKNNQWVYATATWDGSKIAIYINAVKEREVSGYTGIVYDINNVLLGKDGRIGLDTRVLKGSLDEVRIWNRALSADEIQQHYASNLAKYAPDKWLFQSNQSGFVPGAQNYWVIARDAQSNTYIDKRVANVQYRQVGFTSPTPQKRFFTSVGAGAVEPFVINASVHNVTLSSFNLDFNGTNASFYNDSLVLAYNFDDVPAIGDSARQVADVSKYGNNGTIYGNTVALLHMDESNGNITYDEGRLGNNGTCYSAGVVANCNWVAGKSSTGISLDGTDDYVSLGSIVSGTAGTMAIWVKPSGTYSGVAQVVMSGVAASGASASARYAINAKHTGVCASGDWLSVLANGTNMQYACSGQVYNSSNFPAGVWTMLAATYDGSNVRFYRDGLLINSVAQTVPGAGDAQPYVIGRAGGYAGYYYNGSIDEALIANRSLSGDEILNIYNAGRAKHADWTADGKWASAMKFDGIKTYVDLGNRVSLQSFTSKTVLIWVKLPGFTGLSRTVLGGAYWAAPYGDAVNVRATSNNLQISLRNTSGSAVTSDYIPFTPDTWTQVGYAWNGTNITYFKNGAVMPNSPVSLTGPMACNSSHIMLGTDDDFSPTDFLYGSIDEVRIWNRSLSSAEVAQHYYGSPNKYAPDKWLFTSVQSNASATAGTYNYSIYTTDANGQASSFSGRRIVQDDLNKIGFVSPSPADGSTVNYAQAVASPTTINASIAGIVAPSEMTFNWNGTSATYMNDSLVLAYNFDDVAAIGDSAAKVVDLSKYGNNGTIYGNTIALFHMDENTGTQIYDESRFSNNGTISGATWVAGKNGIGLSFDGVNDYVALANNLPNLTDFAVEFWFTKCNAARGHAFSSGSSSSNNLMFDFNDGGYGVWVYWMSNGAKYVRTATTYNDGNWHHLLVTRSGSAVTLYMDGVSKATTTDSTAIVAGSIRIGDNYGSYPWNGSLDEVAIFNRSLSTSEVLAHYNAGKAKHADWTPDGKWNSAMTFDGVDDYVLPRNDTTLYPTNFTIASWVNFSSLPTYAGGVCEARYPIFSNYDYGYNLAIRKTGAAGLSYYSTAGSSNSVSSNALLLPSQFNYVVVTKNGGDLSIYVNGQLSGQSNSSLIPVYYALDALHVPEVGRLYCGGGRYYFNGSIDELRIWNRSLTASEISQHYYSNLAKYAPDKWLFQSTPVVNSTGAYSYWARVKDSAGVSNTTEVRTFSVGVQNWISFLSPTPTSNSNARYGNITINASIANLSLSKMVFSWNRTNYTYLDNSLVLAYNFDDNSAAGDTAGRQADYSNYGNNGTIYGNTVGLWHFDEADGNTTFDESRFGNNGAIYGNTIGLWHFDENAGSTTADESRLGYTGTITEATWVSGKSGSALNFSSTNAKVQTASPILTGTGDFAVSAWIYTYGKYVQYISGNYGSGNTGGLEFYLIANKLGVYIGGSSSQSSVIPNNTWTHVAATRTSGVIRLYKNGVLDSSLTTLASSIAGSRNFAIGNGPDYASERFNGLIDEAAVYNRSLTADEIAAQFSSGKAKHADWAVGKSGTGLQFDGVDDYVRIAPSASLDINRDVTFGAWVKPADSAYSHYNTILAKRIPNAGSANYEVYIQKTTGKFGYFSGSGELASSYAVPANVWTYLVAVVNASHVSYYANGAYIETKAGVFAATNSQPLVIGYANNGDEFFNGTIDEVMIANRSLSASEVLSRYNAGKAKHADWDPNGKWNNAMKFDGVNDYVSIPDSPSVSPATQMTMAAWIYPTSYHETVSSIIAKDDWSSNQRSYDLSAVYTNGSIRALISHNGSNGVGAIHRDTTTAPLVLNAWNYVAATFDGTLLRIYANGIEQPTFNPSPSYGTDPGAIFDSNISLYVGKSSMNNYEFNGSIDEVRIWNRALSADEIQQQYYSNLAKVSPDSWIFTSSQNITPTGSSPIPYYLWVRDDRTWGANSSEARVINRQ